MKGAVLASQDIVSDEDAEHIASRATMPPASLPYTSSTNGNRTRLLLICEPENATESVFDFSKLSVTANEESDRATYCLIHEQYFCQKSHTHLPSLLVDPPHTPEDDNALQSISPAEEPDSSEETEAEHGVPIDFPTARPGGRVRFRSRVRIASGLHRQRTSSIRQSGEFTEPDELMPGESSLSSSPSSSISAPLRAETTNDDGFRPGWGPLGQRVRLFACRSKNKSSTSLERELEKRERRRRKLGLPPLDASAYADSTGKLAPNESTPLMGPTGQGRSRSMRVGNRGVQLEDAYDSDDEEDEAAQELDRAYGPLPGRLLNHHWWWWHLEPLVTCNCLNDSDGES